MAGFCRFLITKSYKLLRHILPKVKERLARKRETVSLKKRKTCQEPAGNT
jgi:hypothetical protein